jgi:hypothetical protein
MAVEIKVTPSIKKVREDFAKRQQNFSDFLPVYKKAAILFDQWVQNNFQDEGASLGADRWPDFKYGGRVNDDGKGTPIQIPVPWGVIDAFVDPSAMLLQKSSRLKMSFLPFASKDDAGIGSHLLYSEAHNDGLGFMPERRMLPKEADVHDKVEDLLHAHGMKALKGKL